MTGTNIADTTIEIGDTEGAGAMDRGIFGEGVDIDLAGETLTVTMETAGVVPSLMDQWEGKDDSGLRAPSTVLSLLILLSLDPDIGDSPPRTNYVIGNKLSF